MKDAHRNLRDAEPKLQEAVPAERARDMQPRAKAKLYKDAIEQYRSATLVSPEVSRVLRRTLDVCATCERRCPGLPACELGR